MQNIGVEEDKVRFCRWELLGTALLRREKEKSSPFVLFSLDFHFCLKKNKNRKNCIGGGSFDFICALFISFLLSRSGNGVCKLVGVHIYLLDFEHSLVKTEHL